MTTEQETVQITLTREQLQVLDHLVSNEARLHRYRVEYVKTAAQKRTLQEVVDTLTAIAAQLREGE